MVFLSCSDKSCSLSSEFLILHSILCVFALCKNSLKGKGKLVSFMKGVLLYPEQKQKPPLSRTKTKTNQFI